MADAIVVLLIVVILIFALRGTAQRLKGGCCGGSKLIKIKPKDANPAHYTYKTTVYINGMTCDNCKARVENAFNALPDCYAKVNLKKKSALICSNARMSEDEIVSILTKNGYTFVSCSQE